MQFRLHRTRGLGVTRFNVPRLFLIVSRHSSPLLFVSAPRLVTGPSRLQKEREQEMTTWRVCVYLCVLAAAMLCHGRSHGDAAELSAEQTRQIRRELASFRRARTLDRRVHIALSISKSGDSACALLSQMLQMDLDRAERVLRESQLDSSWRKRVDQLRETMQELRMDPNLSKQRIKDVGDPALEELQAMFVANRQAVGVRRKSLALLHAQLQDQREFLQGLETLDESAERNVLVASMRKQAERVDDLLDEHGRDADFLFQSAAFKNTALAKGLDPDAVMGMQQLNEFRAMLGISPLVVDPKLCKAASEHCSDMVMHDFFSHESSVSGKRSFLDRAKLSGTTATAENIFFGSKDSRSAIKSWYYSPPHHKNMLNLKHHRMGLGHDSKRWTLMLGN